MKLSLTLAAVALIGACGIAQAQTVSGGDAYAQGYAAGAAAKEQNNFDAFQNGASQTQQAAQAQAFNNGVAIGAAQSQAQSSNSQQAYNNGYQDRVSEENTNHAYDNGFRAGAAAQADADADYP